MFSTIAAIAGSLDERMVGSGFPELHATKKKHKSAANPFEYAIDFNSIDFTIVLFINVILHSVNA